jgi:hypothetical protein
MNVMRRNYRGFVLGLLGVVGCTNGGKVFDSSKGNVSDSGTGSGGSGDPNGTGGSESPSGTGGGGNSTGGVASGGANGSGGAVTSNGGATAGGSRCFGACCPADSRCYSTPAGNGSPGSECLATRDNTGQEHIQLRQQWIRATIPAGNAQGLVYGVLAGRSQLPWAMCNQTGAIGSGGYIELIDLFLGGADKSQHYATLGYAQYVPGPTVPGDAVFIPAAINQGLCYGTESVVGKPAANGIDYSLGQDEVGFGADYPPGLPKPMALKGTQGWWVGPTRATRLDADFDLGAGTTRTDLLAMLGPGGAYGAAGFSGVFYYDDTTATLHAFASLSWAVVYDATGSSHIAIPMREAETKLRFNDPGSPNCVGAYRSDAIDPTICQAGSDPLNPGWGGGDCTATTGGSACRPGESAASTTGYFLISELQQIYAPDLQNTLCVTYPGNDPATSKPRVDAEGFYDDATFGCKTANWNPNDPVNGLPQGDWCAATNSAATASCHDAWQGRSFQAFAGSKIRLGTNGAPMQCSF